MSFVTKRERVFKDENDLYDLPPRNEGKLKAYASCTDARAWSHFGSDQSEHLVDIIKRNNASCAPKYVPTKVIVDTIMSYKNCEISRLRRKIDTLDQMLAVYDQLELDCGQKCEIARAHESIKAASRDLDEVVSCVDALGNCRLASVVLYSSSWKNSLFKKIMCLDLDISGYTEGIESEVYETGKSRGDEIEKSKGDMSAYSKVTPTYTEAVGVQNTPPCNDAATVVKDPRIEEMRDEIIFKDAKLNAMQNSMAVLENDVCEPYCIYAHIYTALEKIYGILNQNDTYRQYLELLSAGKDTRCLDIKGRILFKMKILEKFALALLAPCSKKFADEAQKEKDCDCGQTKIVARVETAYALTSSESEPPPTSDSKRAHLVAEIMDNDEMKEILEKDPFISDLLDSGNAYCGLTCYSIDAENVKRLKDLQKSYDDLMECFETLKHEKDLLQVRCRKYNELEMEVETLRDQLASCNSLWSEKERYKKRSSDLEDIHEKYLILQNVAENLESELKAEKEINNTKMQLIEDLRNEHLILERKLSDATIAFEREKSALLCKLKEFECALSCKDQEVKSLSEQFQKHFDDNQERERDSIKTFSLLNEIELLKEELMNTKGLLNCCEEEKDHIKVEFSDNLSLVNDLRMQIEDWKDHYEKLLGQKSTMETQFRYDIADLEEKNNKLNEEMDEKTKAISNLMGIISDKSMEINTLLEEIENTKQENEQMLSELLDLRNEHSICKENFEIEKCEAQELLESERRKSKQLEDALNSENQQEILQNVNIQKKYDIRPSDYDSLRGLLEDLSKENHLIKEKLSNGECCQVQDFKKEFDRLNEIIRMLQNDKREGEISKKKLIEELNNWKQKFSNLEKDKINNFDHLMAELNNCKKKLREQGGETIDNLSDNYEEAESSPWKQYHASNANRENVPSNFDKSTSQLRRAEVEKGLWKQHHLANVNESEKISKSQEHTRLSSLVGNASGHASEYRERFPLFSADIQTTRRFSDQPNQFPSLNVTDKALRRDSEPQTRARLFSADEKTTLDLGVKIDKKNLEPSFSRRDSEDQETLWAPGVDNKPTHTQAAEENVTHQDSQYEKQNRQSSFDEKAALINAELKSLSELLSAKEITSHSFYGAQENDALTITPKETTQDILESQERTRRLSYDENASHRVLELRDYADLRSIHRDLNLQDQARLQSPDIRNTLSDSDHQEQFRLLESELRLPSFDEKDSRRDSEPQKQKQLLSADGQALRSDLSAYEKTLGHDSEPQTRANLSSDDENTSLLGFRVHLKEKLLGLDPSVDRDSEIQEKPQTLSIDNKLTSHDLRQLEHARSSAANEIQYNVHKDSGSQEKDQALSSNNENTNSLSVIEGKSWQHKENNYDQYVRHQSDDNDVISENKHSIQQRDSSYEKHHRKLSFGEKSVKDVSLWNNDRDSDYSSKVKHERRPSFGKAEAEESLKKQRRYSETQNYSFDESDQYQSVSESRPRQKRDLEGQTDWKQKFEESERERHAILLSQQDKDMKLSNWVEIFEDLEKDSNEKQALLAKIMEEKRKLEQTLRDKIDELDAEKKRNQLYIEKARRNELIEGELKRSSQSYENALEEKYSLQTQLDNTNTKMAELLQSLEHEKSQLLTLSTRIPDLEQKLKEYQKTIDDTLDERQSIQAQLNVKTNELSKIWAENNALKDELQKLLLYKTTSDENLVILQNQKDELQLLFQKMEKEHDKLLAEMDVYKSIAEDLDNIKYDYDSIQKENKSLRDKLEENEKQFNLLDKKHNDHISALAADNTELENMLIEVREQVVRGLESPERSFYETVKGEVNALKREKMESHAEIRKLKDQQDANENLIAELKGELMTRDERISILENHINLLQDEISQLHKNLEDGVSASEQLQGQAFEGYDESMKKIEAHHSKAFHNMKMELSQLEKENADLQEQLFKTRNQNEESLRDKNAYLSKITDLTNEREIMIYELKKLEHISTGNTGFVTDNDSDIQSVKESFSRISNNLEANRTQSAALESKLHIVKKSSEELFSKTNEAKKIAENEKQKFLLEKSNLERQMQDLKAEYEKQRDNDAATIEDLNKEILNQELLIKEMKDSTQEYIQKLEEDLKTMQNLYKQAQIKINDLENKLKDSKSENDTYKDKIKLQTKTHNDAIAKFNEKLQKYHQEMTELQETLNDLRSVSKNDTDIQTQEIKTRDSSTQFLTSISENRKLQTDFPEKKPRAQERIQGEHITASENVTKFTENITELQIMNANVQPTLDFVKNTYTKYKQGQLSPGPVEQHSILSLVDASIKKDSDNQLIDIFSRRSSDIEESQYDKTNISQSLNTNTIENNNKTKQNVSSSGQSNDEDVFVIYSSNETVHNEQPQFLLPDTSTSNRNEEKTLTLTNKTDLEKGFVDNTNKIFADDVRKPRETKLTPRDRKPERDSKVKISASDEGFTLPKKHKTSITMIGNNESAGKFSQSSYNGDVSQQMLLHSSDTDDDKLKRKETQSKSNLSLNETKPDSEDYFDNLSNDQDDHFKMSRLDGESIISKDKNNKITPETSEKQDLGLSFILETAKQETKETFDYNTNVLRRSQSTDRFSKNSSRTGQETSFPPVNRQQIVSHSVVLPLQGKKVADKEVLINIEPDKASKKIEQLIAALENNEKDYKKKLEAIKAQYDANKKVMVNEHNEGVKNLQNLHEDMIKDLVKKHENEVENLRSISFEAMKRMEKMEKENMLLKSRLGYNGNDILDQEPVKIESRSRVRDARLSKTTIESFDVKPKTRHSGPCTCSLDVNVSDTIRNIFDQVDQDQRKLEEFTYVKYIAHKMMSGNVDALDSQELAFLHYNVCRHWKVKQNIEDTLRKKIDSLETELISKQRHAQQHIAELDRRVAEERRRLQEVREAVGYQPVPGVSHDMQPDRDNSDVGCLSTPAPPPPPPPRNMDAPCSPIRVRKVRPEVHCSERRVPRPQQQQTQPDEMPTRLRRCQDRASRSYRK